MKRQNAVHYHVSVECLTGHYFNVRQTIEQPALEGQIVSLPAWIPGSYMIRDFAKNIVSFRVTDSNNQHISFQKLDKQTWKIAPHIGEITIELMVYAYDFSVRSAFICDEYAFFNGTSLFLKVHGYEGPCSVEVVMPEHKADQWKISTAMSAVTQSKHQALYSAENYDTLIDQPTVIGEVDITVFKVNGIEFEFVLTGSHMADVSRICDDLAKICEHHLALFSAPAPMKRYVFMTLLSNDAFGGLEHNESTVLQFSRSLLPNVHSRGSVDDGYRTFLSLCSHELFHTWHVKKNKPAAFLSPDLSAETYSEQLWIYEGFTSYLDDISLARTSLITPESYLEVLGQLLTRLTRNPGNTKQTVTESSFDAWTRFYKQDASAANTIVSYYAKGAEVALCIDLLMRQRTNGKSSIFDLFEQLWRHYGSQGIGTKNNVIQTLLHKEFNLDLDDFLQQALYTTIPLPTEELLSNVGITVNKRPRINAKDKGGTPADKLPLVDFGAQYTAAGLGIKLTQIIEGTSAYHGGLHVSDIVIAVEQWQITPDNVLKTLDYYADKDVVELTVLRDGKMLRLTLPIAPASLDTVYLTTHDKTARQIWLGLAD